MKTVFVTGAAGFIGAHLCTRLLADGWRVVGLDNLNGYYDVGIKEDRLRFLAEAAGGGRGDADPSGFSVGRFEFVRGDICDGGLLDYLFATHPLDVVVNLAAQAGVRYSIENPGAYVDSNLVGFASVLERCRRRGVGHLVFASSSSVYGGNEKVPYSEADPVDHPVSLYAATKKANELMAHAYAKLYGIPCTGLRFFTVYGPAGRPDMAYFKFTDRIVRGEPIQIYNMGDMRRDFTYVGDIVEGVVRVMGRVPEDCGTGARYKVYNIGGSQPVGLLDFVETLERVLVEEGVTTGPTEHQLLPMQPGDVYQTYADASELEHDLGFVPRVPLEDGLREFARWYRGYHQV